jgi:hypothetical protein
MGGSPAALADGERGPRTLDVRWPDRMDLGMAVDGMLRAARASPTAA